MVVEEAVMEIAEVEEAPVVVIQASVVIHRDSLQAVPAALVTEAALAEDRNTLLIYYKTNRVP